MASLVLLAVLAVAPPEPIEEDRAVQETEQPLVFRPQLPEWETDWLPIERDNEDRRA